MLAQVIVPGKARGGAALPVGLAATGRFAPMAATALRPKPPIVVDHVVGDGEVVRDLARAHGPYWQPGRMLVSSGPVRGTAAGEGTITEADPALVGPVFRGDWAFGEDRIPGAEALLHHDGFIAAAGQMYDTDVVVPEQVYVNLTTPLPRQGFSHTDIPEFRGLDRTNAPAWLLSAMGVSGCFEAERIHIVTAVAWFYRGEAGGLRYWPEGPDGPSVLHDDTWNTAVVGDNDLMPHEVQRVGPRGSMPPAGMTIHSELVHDDGRWHIVDGDDVLASYDDDQVRLSLSWKAKVYPDEAARRRAEAGVDGVTLDEALDRLAADLAGSDHPEPLAGRSVAEPGLREQLTRRYSAYRVSAPPA